jgi:hypothetical protein
MKNEDSLLVKGIVTIEQYREGQKIHSEVVDNLVTTRGKQILVERCFYAEDASYTSPDITSIKIGNDDTIADVLQTDLQGGTTVSKDIHSKEYVSNEMKYFTTFIDKAEDTLGDVIREVGLFSNGGEMICRTVLTTPITKAELDLLNIYWKIIIG